MHRCILAGLAIVLLAIVAPATAGAAPVKTKECHVLVVTVTKTPDEAFSDGVDNQWIAGWMVTTYKKVDFTVAETNPCNIRHKIKRRATPLPDWRKKERYRDPYTDEGLERQVTTTVMPLDLCGEVIYAYHEPIGCKPVD